MKSLRLWGLVGLVALAIGVPAAFSDPPATLNGEDLTLATNSNTTMPGTILVDEAIPPTGCTGVTFHWHATGVAFGPYYAGSFTADGTVTFGNSITDPAALVQEYAVTGFTETFTITSGSFTWTGSKTLAPFNPSLPNIGECGTHAPFGDEIGVHSVNTTYTAHLGSVTECGTNNMEWDYFYTPLPLGGGDGGFNEPFLAGTCAGPAPDQAISASGGYTFNGTEAMSISNGTVATFTDPDPVSMPGEYTASIDWGDTTSSAGSITGPTGGPFTVTGSHTYADEGGPYTITVTITDSDNGSNTATATDSASVADAALSGSGLPAITSGASFTGPVATFTDGNTTSTTADFTATIDWGDGSPASTGTVTGSGGTGYTVSGSHAYATGSYTIKTHVVDDGGSTADASTPINVLVYAFPSGGGDFAIGDKNSAVGTSVTFWGAQWAKLNSLSGGPAPSSFKGFALNPTTPSCGVGWSTDPGNSAPPPAGPLPAYMAVIVTSSATKKGSQISGNTVHMVVVKTNPGYDGNPGHAGTGTVVAQIC